MNESKACGSFATQVGPVWAPACRKSTSHVLLPSGMEDGERPWLKPHVRTPAARDPEPGATRKRPLIYM